MNRSEKNLFEKPFKKGGKYYRKNYICKENAAANSYENERLGVQRNKIDESVNCHLFSPSYWLVDYTTEMLA